MRTVPGVRTATAVFHGGRVLRAVFWLSAGLCVLLGLTHTGVTFIAYSSLSARAVWFAGTGLGMVLLAVVNITAWRTAYRDPFVRYSTIAANLAMSILGLFAVTAVPEPQAFAVLASFSGLLITSLFAARFRAAADMSMRDHSTDRGSEDQAHQALLAVAKAWGTAIVSNDADAIGRFMANDWVIVSETGVSEKQQFLSLVESGELTHDSMTLIEGTERLRRYGDTAVITGRVTNRANYKGETFDADEWTTDVFQQIDREWKCVLSHITAVRK